MFEQFITSHPVLGPLGFITARTLAVLIPGFPTVTIDIPGLLMFGMFPGFFYAEIGIILGASISFFIGRYFKKELVRFFPRLQELHTAYTHSDTRTFFVVIAMRLSTLPLFDYVTGFLNISYTHFLIATIIGSTPPTLLFYYLGTKALNFGVWYAIGFAFLGIITVIYIRIYHPKKWLRFTNNTHQKMR